MNVSRLSMTTALPYRSPAYKHESQETQCLDKGNQYKDDVAIGRMVDKGFRPRVLIRVILWL